MVAKELLARGRKVRVLVRNPEKAAALKAQGAELVQGDVTDTAAVARALEGAQGAYLLVPPDVGDAVEDETHGADDVELDDGSPEDAFIPERRGCVQSLKFCRKKKEDSNACVCAISVLNQEEMGVQTTVGGTAPEWCVRLSGRWDRSSVVWD